MGDPTGWTRSTRDLLERDRVQITTTGCRAEFAAGKPAIRRDESRAIALGFILQHREELAESLIRHRLGQMGILHHSLHRSRLDANRWVFAAQPGGRFVEGLFPYIGDTEMAFHPAMTDRQNRSFRERGLRIAPSGLPFVASVPHQQYQ